MSKELEALKNVRENIWNIPMKYIDETIHEKLDIIKRALTPPTQEEVCEALSAWAGKKIKYLPLTDKNYECFTDGKYHYFVNDIDCNEVIEWLPCPVYIMSLIGRFYERLELMRDE